MVQPDPLWTHEQMRRTAAGQDPGDPPDSAQAGTPRDAPEHVHADRLGTLRLTAPDTGQCQFG